MELKVWWTDNGGRWSIDKALGFGYFLQKMVDKFAQGMADRLIVGIFRYDKGKPLKKAKYLTRLKAEVAEYERTGNQEHLINAANYCYLETQAPEHPKSHFKHHHKSVTRDKLKMKI